jgi:nickel-dependent lactate racemase
LEFWVPYGATEVPVRVPDTNFYRILEPAKPVANTPDIATMIARSLESPIGNISLTSLVKQGSTIGIVVDPAIPELSLKLIVDELQSRLLGLGAKEVRIFVRTRKSFQIQSGWKAISPQEDTFVEVGKTNHGTRVSVEQGFHSCEVKILVGVVQPHFASGFAGGPDLVVPGVASLPTIEANRRLSLSHQSDPFQYSENPVYLDSLEASRMLGSSYLLTLVPDEWNGVSAVYSGDIEPTFKEAVAHFTREHSRPIENRPEIIVVSSDGPEYSNDLYHAVRVLPFLWNILKRDSSTIVLAGECKQGIGNDNFLKFSKNSEDRKTLQNELKHDFKLGGHVALLLKEALEKSRVQLVSVLPDVYTRSFGLKPSRTVSAGVQSAIRAEGKDSKVLIVTKGSLMIPVMAAS